MEHEGEGTLPRFVLQDGRYVLVGVSGVDHQGQPGLTRGGNVPPKTRRLRNRSALIMIIQTDLADRDAARMLRQPNQVLGLNMKLFVRVMRMRSNRAPDLAVLFGDRADLVEPLDPVRDRHHAVDTIGVRPCQDTGAIRHKLRKVEMAVAVDQHVQPALACSNFLNTGSGAGSLVPAATIKSGSSACCSRRWSAGTASRSSFLAADAGTNGCAAIAQRRTTSAVVARIAPIRARSPFFPHGAWSAKYRFAALSAATSSPAASCSCSVTIASSIREMAAMVSAIILLSSPDPSCRGGISLP